MNNPLFYYFIYLFVALIVYIILLKKPKSMDRSIALIWYFYQMSFVFIVHLRFFFDYSKFFSNNSIPNTKDFYIITITFIFTEILLVFISYMKIKTYFKIIFNSLLFLILHGLTFLFGVNGSTNFLWLFIFCAAATGITSIFDIFIFDDTKLVNDTDDATIKKEHYIETWCAIAKEIIGYGLNAALAFCATIGVAISIIYSFNASGNWGDVSLLSGSAIYISGLFLTLVGFYIWICYPYFHAKRTILKTFS